MLNNSHPLRFGVNYTPLKNWYYCWNEWDIDAIRRELDMVAELEVDHIRLQLIWPYFQPNPTYVSATHLRRLRELMAVAAQRGLDVLPSVLTGFLSGYFFLPPNVAARDVFRSDDVFESIVAYFQRVLETVGDCENLMGIDLGNEVNCLDHTLAPAEGDDWARRLMARIAEFTPELPIVNGIDHTPLFDGSTFSLPHLANDYSMISLHAWPLFTGCLEYGELDDPPSLNMAAFLTRFIRTFARDASRSVWIQEFGCCDLWGDAGRQERYLRHTIASAVAAGATCFTFWCSHDKPRDMRFDEYEYHYGLIDNANRPKRLGRIYRELIRQYRPNPPPTTPEALNGIVTIPDDFRPRFRKSSPPAKWVEQQASSTLWSICETYLQSLEEGAFPTDSSEEGL